MGNFHSCAVLDNLQMKCWGYGQYGQLGQGALTRNSHDVRWIPTLKPENPNKKSFDIIQTGFSITEKFQFRQPFFNVVTGCRPRNARRPREMGENLAAIGWIDRGSIGSISVIHVWSIWSISGWWFQTWFLFSIYGMSSFPLTNSIIFKTGTLHHQYDLYDVIQKMHSWVMWADEFSGETSVWWKRMTSENLSFFLSALTHLVKLIGFGELRNSMFFMLLAKSKSRQKYAELIYRFPVSDCFHWSFSSWEASKESLLHRPGKQPNGRASCSWRITHLCFVGQSCHQMPPGFTAVPKQGYPKTNGL